MKINKSKFLSVPVCCFLVSLWSEAQCMESLRDDLISEYGNKRWVTIVSGDGKALDSWDPGSITVGAVPLNSRVDGNYEKQLWKIEKENNDCYFIISKHSSKCLDSRGPGNNRIGKSYKQTPEHQAYASQLWKITKEYDSNGWFNGCYFIRNDHSGARLDSWGGHDGGGDTGKTVSHHAPGHPAYPHQLWKLNIVPYDKYRAKEGHRQMEMELHLQSNGRPRRDSTGNGGHDRLER